MRMGEQLHALLLNIISQACCGCASVGRESIMG